MLGVTWDIAAQKLREAQCAGMLGEVIHHETTDGALSLALIINRLKA